MSDNPDLITAPPVREVCDRLRNLLIDAELGAIQAIAFVGIRADGATVRGRARPGDKFGAELAIGVMDMAFSIQQERESLYLDEPEGCEVSNE